MARESYEDYMKRRIREEDAQYEERKWKEFEKQTRIMYEMANRKFDERGDRIFESPDGGKTIYERKVGSNIRRLARSPEEQKINEHRNLPSGWREITTKDGVDFTPPEPDETYPAREDIPAELWGKNIKEALATKTDMVNHPPHYNKGIETTTYINSWDMNFSQGNVVKYVTRYNLKHDTKEKQLEDLKKARWYLEDLIKKVQGE